MPPVQAQPSAEPAPCDARPWARLTRAVRHTLPRGRTLPDSAWDRRHRALLVVLWLHVVALPIFSLARGNGVEDAIRFAIPIGVAGAVASARHGGRRARSVAIALGLLTSSALLVHAWDGRIEAHFHFFVDIAVMALYEDWLPFGIAVAYVVGEHGVVGVLAPHEVYDHGGNPWMWAAVHGAFAASAAVASLVTWRLNEDERVRTDEADRQARETDERFRRAFDSGVTGMALVSADGQFLSANRALCEITGYAEEELVGRAFQSITHADDLPVDVEQQQAMRRGTIDAYETEKRYRHRDGHDVWVELGVSAVRDDDGAVRYFVSQMHDVT